MTDEVVVKPAMMGEALDAWDKYLFLQSINRENGAEYVPFEDALAECGVSFDEL